MYFKKSICMILSLCTMVGGAFIAHCGVHAMPTKSVLNHLEDEDFSDRDRLVKVFKRTRDFIRIENKKDLGFYDNARERADSLAFNFFCYLCLKENTESFSDLVDKAIGLRDVSENNEDIMVVDYIFPQNADEFIERFGLELDEVTRVELSRRVHQWRPDTGCTLRVSERMRRQSERSYRRKPEREVQERLRDGIREYRDMRDYIDSDASEDYSDCESE